MPIGFQLIIAILAGFILTGLILLFTMRPLINFLTDKFIKRLMKDPYPENLSEMYNVFLKVGVQNVLEADLRGNQGEALQRPFGSPRHNSHWEQLMLNPVYLSRLPIMESVGIDTKVVIGPEAQKPMEIDLPIMFGGMAYGIGLSFNAKIALAKAADIAGTATNTGVGPFLPEERKHTKRLILQYHRGHWAKDETVLRQADMIEIQLGYGALGPAPVLVKPKEIMPELRDFMEMGPNQSLLLDTTLPNVHTSADFAKLVATLREITGGVPIGVKIGATHYLEKELAIFTRTKLDFIAIDGAEAGINHAPTILEDDLGLPTLPALCRAVHFLKERNLKGKTSLIISGGFVTPGQVLKAIALGADAVYIGTIACIALAHLQLSKVLPWEPPTELIFAQGKQRKVFSIDEGAKNASNFLKSCHEELTIALRSMGRTSLKAVTLSDLVALTPEMAQMTGTELGLYSPGKNGGSKDE